MIISRTPFRVSFFGGGTDYPAWFQQHGGRVLTSTIDKYCYLTVRLMPPFFEHRSRIVWSRIELVNHVKEIYHPAVRGVLQFLDLEKGVEILHYGDLPARSGLGSSSAFTVGLLNALYYLLGKTIHKNRLAADAITVEQKVLAESVGIQDQIQVVHGGLNLIKIHRDGTYGLRPLWLPEERLTQLESHLMLFFTGISRFSSQVAKSQIDAIPEKSMELHQMAAMVEPAVNIITGHGPLTEFGRLLHASWLLKRSLSDKVTNARIDEIYDAALGAGAVGGKRLGAGGGRLSPGLRRTPPAAQGAGGLAGPGGDPLQVRGKRDAHRLRRQSQADGRGGVVSQTNDGVRHFLYCDITLVSNLVGDHANQCRLVLREVARRGWVATVLSSREIFPGLAAELEAVPLFRLSPAKYERLWSDPVAATLKCFYLGAGLTLEDWRGMQGVRAGDVIHVACAHPFQLLACIDWAQELFAPDACPDFVFEFRIPMGVIIAWDKSGDERYKVTSLVPSLLRYAMTRLQPGYFPHFHFVATSPEHARVYADLLERPVRLLPMIETATTSCRLRRKARPLTLSVLGFLSRGKGYEPLPALLEAVLARRDDVNVLVCNGAPHSAPELVGPLRDLAAREPRVEYRDGGEDPDLWKAWIEGMELSRWSELLERTDLLLVLHERRWHDEAPLGIVAEAIANGIPLLVRDDTASAELVRAFGHGGAFFEESAAGSVLDGVLSALDDFDALAVRAHEGSRLWREKMGASAYVEAMLRSLAAPGESRSGSGEGFP